MRRSQALHKDCLLSVRENPGIDASAFSQKLHRPLQDGSPKLQPAYVAPQGFRVFLELLDASAVIFPRQFAGRLLAQELLLPIIERRPLDAESVGDDLCGPAPGDEVDDGLFFGFMRKPPCAGAFRPATGL